MRDLWQVYDAHYSEISEATARSITDQSEFMPIMRSMSAGQMAEQQRASRELLQAALVNGEWDAYLTNLRLQGAHYARIGISFPGWFELLNAFHKYLIPLLCKTYADATDRLPPVLNALNMFSNLGMATIGESYLNTKQEIILQQQEAIRELSTPVLKLRDRLLLLPIIGVLDSFRARQLTGQLLQAVRTHRARVVVVDITGVPTVDSMVANHLIQTVEATRLMGATAIVTGLSAEIAQTLVRIGVNLTKLNTVGDLQGGIEEASRLLGRDVVRIGDDIPLIESDQDGSA
ncbi:MAG: STAS domain-containing protein [Chloroflexi bacterium]|nr:STAS domain-containing protein [Chloroflexota bacterium]